MGLSPLGFFHTLVSLVALATGAAALVQDKQIDPRHGLAQIYIWTTLVTALTGLGIFHHGGFGPPHVLSILTVIALGVGTVASRSATFGAASLRVQAVSFSSTFLFHLIPAVTETSTRLPPGAPLAANPDVAGLKIVYLVLIAAFAVGLRLQLRWLGSTGSAALAQR